MNIPADPSVGYIAIILFLIGLFLFISGLNIVRVEKVTVSRGFKTWIIGLILMGAGVFLGIPKIMNNFNHGEEDQVASDNPTVKEPTKLLKNEKENHTQLEGWVKGGRSKESYSIGVDNKIFHTKPPSYYIKSASERITNEVNGTFVQKLDISIYRGKRVQITAYVKSTYPEKTGNSSYFFISGHSENETYESISNKTDWHKVSFVVDIAETANHFQYGLSLWGKGQIWIDEVSFVVVDKDTPLNPPPEVREPTNLP